MNYRELADRIVDDLQDGVERRWPDASLLDWSPQIPEDVRRFFEKAVIKATVKEISQTLRLGSSSVNHLLLGPRDRE